MVLKEERTDIFGRLLPCAIKVPLAVEEVAFDIFNIPFFSFVGATETANLRIASRTWESLHILRRPELQLGTALAYLRCLIAQRLGRPWPGWIWRPLFRSSGIADKIEDQAQRLDIVSTRGVGCRNLGECVDGVSCLGLLLDLCLYVPYMARNALGFGM